MYLLTRYIIPDYIDSIKMKGDESMGIGCRPIGKFKSEMVKIENKIAKEKAAHVVKKNNKKGE